MALGPSQWDRTVGERIEARPQIRNAVPPSDDRPIDRTDLDGWMTAVQAPDVDELALFDPPPAERRQR